MGRHAEGWKLEWRRGIGYVRFTYPAKKQHLISTGKRDPGEARAEAARLYSRVVGGGVARPASTRALIVASLTDLFAEWLASLHGVLDPETIKTYETTYAGKHWPAHYDSIEDMCSEAARERYRAARLKAATADTVKKECWAQDKFLRWCCKVVKVIGAVPPALEWDKRTTGTRTGKQRKTAQELTREQVAAFLAALPEWREVGKRAREKRPFPVRDRFVFMYETSLRPATLSALVWGDWDGTRELTIRAEDDKTRYGRKVPLSTEALSALHRVREAALVRGVGVAPADPIFGKHLYLKTIAKAARAAGLKSLAPYDLRHARGTHLADAGGSLTGIGLIMGHTQATTTSRYLHGSAKAAEETLFKGSAPSTPRTVEEIEGDRRVSNPRQLEPQSAEPVTDPPGYGPTIAAGTRGKPAEAASNRVPDLESSGDMPADSSDGPPSVARVNEPTIKSLIDALDANFGVPDRLPGVYVDFGDKATEAHAAEGTEEPVASDGGVDMARPGIKAPASGHPAEERIPGQFDTCARTTALMGSTTARDSRERPAILAARSAMAALHGDLAGRVLRGAG